MPRPLQDWGFGPEGSVGSRVGGHNGANPNARAFALGSSGIETLVFRNRVGRVPSPLIAFFRDPFSLCPTLRPIPRLPVLLLVHPQLPTALR